MVRSSHEAGLCYCALFYSQLHRESVSGEAGFSLGCFDQWIVKNTQVTCVKYVVKSQMRNSKPKRRGFQAWLKSTVAGNNR